MKSLRIISYVLMVLGVLIYVTGILFKIQHWPDMFKGLTSGPIIVFIGTMTFLLTVILNKKNKDRIIN
jgi:F0F1-type ATP synthase assembly protein I